MENENILLIRTGGTFESEPYEDKYNPPPVVETLKGDRSPLPALVASYGDVDLHPWNAEEEDRFNKDSKKFTIDDIKKLAAVILNDKHRFFVLTHGTDALTANAELLQRELGETDKTVVLVGAMVPLSMYKTHGGDAMEALDHVIGNIKEKSAGIWVAGINPKTNRRAFFNPSQVDKDWVSSTRDLNYTLGPPSRA